MSKLEEILDDCLARLASGEATPEECLALYPEHAAELRPLLALPSRLEQGRLVQPSPAFKRRTRAQLAAYMHSHPRQKPTRSWPALWPSGFGSAFGRAFNFAFGAAATLLLVLGTVTVLAQMALPGDALYRWKVASERVWRAVHRDPLYTDLLLAARRASELTQVVGDAQAEEVARQEYRQSLDTLMTEYPSSDSQAVISDALSEQKNDLAQAGLNVPELDRFLLSLSSREANLLLDNQVTAVDNGLITYRLTVTNTGPARLVTATLFSQLSPGEKLVSASNAVCTSSLGKVTCTVDRLAAETPRTLNLTTAIDPCYAGVITQTTTVTGTGPLVNIGTNNEAVAVATITAPFPRPAQVAYVQSSGQTHDLSLESSDNQVLNLDFHVWAAAPAWSPDGQRLAFFGEGGISELGGAYSQGSGVWVVDLSGVQARNPRQLVALDHVKNMAWSPDGTKLAFEVGPPGIPHEIRVIKPSDGQEISRFIGEQPAWTPDSQQLVIKSCAPQCGLWQVNLNGRPTQRLTSGDSDSFPAWSPTGEYLAFSSQRDGDWEIYLLHGADGEVQRLTWRRGTDTTPVFGPCGQDLYLRTDVYGSWWVTVMKLDGSDERKIQEGVGPSDDWGLARPAVY
ncbi:MAG: PD40 domain-containing protein [Anaerolineales bacterium]|nr:PD40 domain-containing protein [Anaerolineales bacterium]